MIIGLLLELIYALFYALTAAISIGSAPVQLGETLAAATQYMFFGLTFLNNYVDVPYMLTLFGIVLAMDAAFGIYDFVMWVLKKIPMVGIE